MKCECDRSVGTCYPCQVAAADHAEAAGALCRDDGTGLCAECGVGLSRCDVCGGTGYHDPACPDAEPADLPIPQNGQEGFGD